MTLSRRQTLTLGLAALTLPALGGMALADGHGHAHMVEIKGHKFTPASLTIKAGETVKFVNADRAPHTATADDESFDTGRLGKNDAGEITFATAGTFDYYCAVHPSMRATIIVE